MTIIDRVRGLFSRKEVEFTAEDTGKWIKIYDHFKTLSGHRMAIDETAKKFKCSRNYVLTAISYAIKFEANE